MRRRLVLLSLVVGALLLVTVSLAVGAARRIAATTSATTDQPSNVTSSTATLNGHATLACAGTHGFVGNSGTTNWSGSAAAGSSSFNRPLTGLQPGTTYSYYAFAKDCANVFAADNPVVFTTPARLKITINGSGKVIGNGISCASSCSADVPNAKSMTLSFQPSGGWQFTGWGGLCAGQGFTCTFVPTGNADVSATFAAVKTLTIAKPGDGTGTIASDGGQINCGSTCSAAVATGSKLKLTATAAADSVFTGWSGGCASAGTAASCTVTLASDLTVIGTFAKLRKLSVAVHGNGAVTSTPTGIDCRGACSGTYPPNAAVTLKAVADPGWSFRGWSGPCSGREACSLTLANDTNVQADFAPLFTLRVIPVGGRGTVRSVPGGIACGRSCSKTYLQDTVVTLRASAAKGFRFAGWGGDCHGKGACAVRMRKARAVVAHYEKR